MRRRQRGRILPCIASFPGGAGAAGYQFPVRCCCHGRWFARGWRILSARSLEFLDSGIQETGYERLRTDTNTRNEAIAELVAALPDLADYGTVTVNDGGGLTIPAAARRSLGLGTPAQWRVLGSPSLGLALVVGPRRSAAETLAFLLRGGD